MAKKKKNSGYWIQDLKKGTFTAKAKRGCGCSGMTVDQYAKKVLAENSKASTETKRQAVAAQTLKKLRKKKKKK